jgi:hypothetical protein
MDGNTQGAIRREAAAKGMASGDNANATLIELLVGKGSDSAPESYVPALYNRVGHVKVTALTEKVAADLDLGRNWKPGTLKDDGQRGGSEKGFRQ